MIVTVCAVTKKALEKLHGSDSKDNVVIRRYFKLDYKAQSWKHEQRVIAKIEVSAKGTNIRFVVTKNRNNSPETIYKRYCKRGEMELLDKRRQVFQGRPYVMQLIPGQLFPPLPPCRGFCRRQHDKT